MPLAIKIKQKIKRDTSDFKKEEKEKEKKTLTSTWKWLLKKANIWNGVSILYISIVKKEKEI